MSRMSGLVIDQIKHRRIVSRTGCFTWEEEGKVKKERDEPFRLADCRPRPADRDVWADGRHAGQSSAHRSQTWLDRLE